MKTFDCLRKGILVLPTGITPRKSDSMDTDVFRDWKAALAGR